MSRTTRYRTLTTATAALTLAGAVSACSTASKAAPLSSLGGTHSANTKQHPDWSKYTFTIGDNGGDGTQALAAATGVFNSAPYRVKFARFTFGPPLIQAAASGDIDLGSVGDVPPITGAAKTYGFKIVAVERSLKPDQANEDLLVPKGSTIRTLAQLRGKKIAVPQGSSAHGLVLNALASVGLIPRDVHLDFLDPAAGATAFQSGKVDAWAIWSPQSALAIKNGAHVVAKGLPPIDQTSSYYVASDASLKNPAKRAALTDALRRVAAEFAWAVRHENDYAKAIAKETGIDLSDAKTDVQARQLQVGPIRSSDVAAEQKLSDAFLRAGQITKSVTVNDITDNLLPTDYDSTKELDRR